MALHQHIMTKTRLLPNNADHARFIRTEEGFMRCVLFCHPSISKHTSFHNKHTHKCKSTSTWYMYVFIHTRTHTQRFLHTHIIIPIRKYTRKCITAKHIIPIRILNIHTATQFSVFGCTLCAPTTNNKWGWFTYTPRNTCASYVCMYVCASVWMCSPMIYPLPLAVCCPHHVVVVPISHSLGESFEIETTTSFSGQSLKNNIYIYLDYIILIKAKRKVL